MWRSGSQLEAWSRFKSEGYPQQLKFLCASNRLKRRRLLRRAWSTREPRCEISCRVNNTSMDAYSHLQLQLVMKPVALGSAQPEDQRDA